MDKCKVGTCSLKAVAQDYCHKHYARFKKHGDPEIVKQEHVKGMSPYCQGKGCRKKSVAKGLCATHYRRFRLYGSPEIVKQNQVHGLSLEDRFWHYVAKSKGCWLWTGTCDKNGYGRLMIDANPLLAHRLSWNIHYGDIPPTDSRYKKGESKHVLHHCDNPTCVNPEHLYLGTPQDNTNDMWNRGRAKPGHLVGEKHGMAKLTEAQVREIRQGNETYRVLAKRFGVSATTIADVRHRHIWKHID
jgi:hypothetical protein